MKLRHQDITIRVLVPEGYHVSEVKQDSQPVVPRIANILGADYNTISDIITTRITITKDKE